MVTRIESSNDMRFTNIRSLISFVASDNGYVDHTSTKEIGSLYFNKVDGENVAYSILDLHVNSSENKT